VQTQREHYFDNGSVSNVRDTDSTSTWLGRIHAGEGSDHPSQAGDAVAGGAAGGALMACHGGI